MCEWYKRIKVDHELTAARGRAADAIALLPRLRFSSRLTEIQPNKPLNRSYDWQSQPAGGPKSLSCESLITLTSVEEMINSK